MPGTSGLRRACAAAALALAAPGAGAASIGTPEYTEFLPVWLSQVTPGNPVPALLNLPPGWQAGDAVVVVAAGPGAPEALRYRLSAAVIDAGAAVLEVHIATGREADLPRVLAEGLTALRETYSAGVVVAIGADRTAAAVLAAVHSDQVVGGGYNGAAVMQDGRLRVVAGAAPGMGEGWPRRAPMLCTILAGVFEATPRGFVEGCARELAGR